MDEVVGEVREIKRAGIGEHLGLGLVKDAADIAQHGAARLGEDDQPGTAVMPVLWLAGGRDTVRPVPAD